MFHLSTVSYHATALQVFKTGVLVTGPSGSGKSECALELINRGHRLVADDLVFIQKTENRTLLARAKQDAAVLLSIRGVGLVDVNKVYGTQSTATEVTPNLVIEISKAKTANDYDLLGADKKTLKILGVPITHVVLPPSSPESLATKIELIVKKKSLSS